MITGWLLYCVAVSALLCGCAAAIDEILTRRRRPARWVWALAIAGSLVLPATAFLLQQRDPTPLPRAGAMTATTPFDVALGQGSSPAGASAADRAKTLIGRLPRSPEVVGGDRLAVGVAVVCILVATLRIAADSTLLFYRRRRWTSGTVDGVPVLLSTDIGPAIVGLIEPAIVVPRWMELLDAPERTLMLAHEQEHVRASDGRLTTAALLAVMCAPWNPMVWFALRRLRTAIEVDCDRRVLRRFPNVSSYGRLLVDVAQRAVGSSFAIAGFSERAAPLARRILAMTPRTQPRRLVDAAMALGGAGALVAAMLVLPPNAPARSLPEYTKSVKVLPKNVGDSIAEGEAPPRVVRPASGLPTEFEVVEVGVADRGLPAAAKCAARLHDPRDDTRLLLSMSTTTTSGVVQRGDTSWTRVGSLGFYNVSPIGRYGVATEQTLRVGCGAYTRISVGGRDLGPAGTITLDSPDDDRGRQIASIISAELGVAVRAIELRRGRLNLFIDDTTVVEPGKSNRFTREAFDIVGRVVGAAAVPETLAVSIRPQRAKWITMYYYRSMQK